MGISEKNIDDFFRKNVLIEVSKFFQKNKFLEYNLYRKIFKFSWRKNQVMNLDKKIFSRTFLNKNET
jgi:hypothetical protein